MEGAEELPPHVHIIRKGVCCITEPRGHATPSGLDPIRLIVNAPGGFIPLWAKGTTLRWRFAERTLAPFSDPIVAESAIERLLAEAVLLWGDATPVKFAKRSDAWDFEIVVKRFDECNSDGCVLASAFFPDGGRHELSIYPRMFKQSRQEQIETMAHEIGHVFGLRHFFALVEETRWPAEQFGSDSKFTIMNYDDNSILTETDKADLIALYRAPGAARSPTSTGRRSGWSGPITRRRPAKAPSPSPRLGPRSPEPTRISPQDRGFSSASTPSLGSVLRPTRGSPAHEAPAPR